jgi:hypothetical protein
LDRSVESACAAYSDKTRFFKTGTRACNLVPGIYALREQLPGLLDTFCGTFAFRGFIGRNALSKCRIHAFQHSYAESGIACHRKSHARHYPIFGDRNHGFESADRFVALRYRAIALHDAAPQCRKVTF